MSEPSFHVWVNPRSTQLPIRRQEIRFAVGTPSGASTNSWKLWAKGNDVYLACRDNFKEIKVSLHASGIWRLAWTSEAVIQRQELLSNTGDRIIRRWTPDLVGNPAVVAFELAVPPASLYLHSGQRSSGWPNNVVFLELPEGEHLMVITLVIVNSSEPLQFTEAQPGFVFGIVPLAEERSAQAVAVLYDPIPFAEAMDQAIRVAIRDVEREHVPPEGVTLLIGARENGASWLVPLPNRILLDVIAVDGTVASPDAS